MDLKYEKGVEPHLPDVVTHRRPHRTRFQKVFFRAGMALALISIYQSYHTLQKINAWKHSCTTVSDPFDNYVNRVEDAFLSVPSCVSNPVADEYVHSAVPSTESAVANSRYYATHPHLAGSEEDFQDAKDILSLFQNEFGISSLAESIFDAGSPESARGNIEHHDETQIAECLD
ncbi:hypothetical protein JVU11DRAFT_1568 [Chiua virens]|nr:hypothetical protein JVU11DRAFT_1568 [Chiua virens]